MKVKFLLIGLVFLTAYIFSSGSVLSDDEIVNLVPSGDFESEADKAEWRLNLADAQATMELDKKDAAIGESSLFIDGIVLDPARSWKPQIDDGLIPITENGVYTFSAFLKAEEQRDVGMYAEIPVDPWTKSPNKTVTVTTEWVEYWATDVPPGPESRLGFANQGSTVSYWIDGIRFYPGEYVPTEIDDGPKIAVKPAGKLATAWGELKQR
jgi:hypothetical protein